MISEISSIVLKDLTIHQQLLNLINFLTLLLDSGTFTVHILTHCPSIGVPCWHFIHAPSPGSILLVFRLDLVLCPGGLQILLDSPPVVKHNPPSEGSQHRCDHKGGQLSNVDSQRPALLLLELWVLTSHSLWQAHPLILKKLFGL